MFSARRCGSLIQTRWSDDERRSIRVWDAEYPSGYRHLENRRGARSAFASAADSAADMFPDSGAREDQMCWSRNAKVSLQQRWASAKNANAWNA